MIYIKRILNIELPQRQSAFLWGPRKTGKSTYLKNRFPNSIIFNFLKTDFFIEVSKNPALLREQILVMDKNVLKNPINRQDYEKLVDDIQHYLKIKRIFQK